MSSQRTTEDREAGTSALLILLFIVLLIAKAAGYDLEWGVVTAPIWGRLIYFVVVEALGLRREE